MRFFPKLKISLLFNNLHFIAFGLIFLALSLKYYFMWPIFGLYFLFLLFKTKIVKWFIFICILFMLSNIRYIVRVPLNSSVKEFSGYIISIEEKSNNYELTVMTKKNKILVFAKDIGGLTPGDVAIFYGLVGDLKNNTYPNLFNYKNYLENQGINSIFYANKIIFQKRYFSPQYLQFRLADFFSYYPEPLNNYLNTLILGNNVLDNETDDLIESLGIKHLFAISGLHINLITAGFYLVFKYTFLRPKTQDLIICIFLIFFLFISFFAISVFRSILMFIFMKYNVHKKKAFTTLDSLSFSMIILLIINPKNLFLLSFQLTFLVTFILLMSNELLNKKSNILKLYILQIISFSSTLPFILNTNYEINFISLLIGPFMVIIFSYLLLPAIFLSLIMPWLGIYINQILFLFQNILNFWQQFDFLFLRFGSLNLFFMIIYYILFFMILSRINDKKKSPKLIMIFLILLIFIYHRNYFNPLDYISFLDVGQGNTTIIRLAHNQGVVVIDAYGDVSNILKSEGIRIIDLLIITHNHEDHALHLETLLRDFRVKQIVLSKYNQDLIKDLNGKNLSLVEANMKKRIGKIEFNFLAPFGDESNENNESIVMKFRLAGKDILLTGDIEKEVEERLLKENLKSDILQVPHHGSNTSSTFPFVESVNPQFAIFSYALKNQYGFPHQEVLNRYSNTIFSTANNGSISFIFFSDKMFTKTSPP